MKRHLIAAGSTLGLVAVLAGCSSEPDPMAAAFCADLESGMSISNIVMGAGENFPGYGDGLRIALNVEDYVEQGCPALLDDERVSSFLDAQIGEDWRTDGY